MCASAPSFVSRSAPVVSASRRPTGTTRERVVDELDDGGAAVRVARGRDHSRRLVQQHVGEWLRLDRPAVHLHPVARFHERIQLPGLAVDCHPAGLDQLVGAAA